MKVYQQRLLHSGIGLFEGKNRIGNQPRQCTVSQVSKNDDKNQELGFEFLPHPPYSPELPPSDYLLFSDRFVVGKKFSSNEEVFAETEAYFEAKDKS